MAKPKLLVEANLTTDKLMPPILSLCSIPHSASIDQACRLFHGRGRRFAGLEHICIDWLPPVILITLYKPESLALLSQLQQDLLAAFPECTSIQLQHRYQQQGPIEVTYGKSLSNLVIKENDLKYHLRLGQTRNNGLFLDMRNGREWVRQNSKGKRVLNLFAYTCGFSVAAIAGGAESVLNVDLSSSALGSGRENHRLNRQNTQNITFQKLDIFRSFGRFRKKGPFDLLVCDPPTFQLGSVDIARDYPKIIRRLNQFMAPDATLLLCLNAPHLSRQYLLETMMEFAPEYAFVEDIPPPAVFDDAENKGLKTLAFRHQCLNQA